MGLSKFTTVLLWGMVALKGSAFAKGTKAGTEVTVEPIIEYTIAGEKVKEEVEKAKYVVDKIVQFKVTRVAEMKQKSVKGLNLLAPFKVENDGNSIENFVLNVSYGRGKRIEFDKTVIYVDKNHNGKLESFEEVESNVIKNLRPGSSQLVWLGAVTPTELPSRKRIRFGLEAKASRGGRDSIYLESARVNNILKEDTVFGDSNSENDDFFNNKYITRYLWSIEKSINLGMKLETNIMSADPLNGIAKTKEEAEAGKFFSIPNATHVQSWKIYNESLVTVKDVYFSIPEKSDVEKFAKSSKYTWWSRDKRIHILLSSDNKIIGEGKYNSKRKSIDFRIKELRGGEVVYPHVVTTIR